MEKEEKKSMTKKCYISYGSNLNIKQMKSRCPDAEIVGTSWIEDYELLFKGRESGFYLTIEPKEGSRVPVGVWLVSEEDEKELDEYEDYPTFYYKKEMVLSVKDYETGEVVERNCFVYIMYEHYDVGVPTDEYMEVCLEGYQDFGFDERYLRDILKRDKD